MEKKKERSSKQKLRIGIGQESGEHSTLLLANPMAGGEVNLHTLVSPNDHIQPRASLQKKSRPKSPSLLRFFVRGSRKASEDFDESVDSVCSDHEDSLSSQGSHSQCSLSESNTSIEPHLRFNRNIAAYVTMPRRKRRVEKRDSGFHSERSDSTSHDKEQHSASPEDLQPSPVPADDRPVGMEALEALHNQIQILVKQDCPEEETQVANLHDAVIASLRHQLDDVQQTLEFLRQSDQNLRLALRDAEQRTLEAETKLFKCTERNQRLERKLEMMTHKYQQVKAHAAQASSKPLTPNTSALSMQHHLTSANKSSYYSPQTQHVHRGSPTNSSGARQRPSSAQSHREPISSVETRV